MGVVGTGCFVNEKWLKNELLRLPGLFCGKSHYKYIAGQAEISILELQGEKKGASNEGTDSWMQEKDFILAVGFDNSGQLSLVCSFATLIWR